MTKDLFKYILKVIKYRSIIINMNRNYYSHGMNYRNSINARQNYIIRSNKPHGVEEYEHYKYAHKNS